MSWKKNRWSLCWKKTIIKTHNYSYINSRIWVTWQYCRSPPDKLQFFWRCVFKPQQIFQREKTPCVRARIRCREVQSILDWFIKTSLYDPIMFLQSILTKCSSNLNGEKNLTTTPTGFLLTCDWTFSFIDANGRTHLFHWARAGSPLVLKSIIKFSAEMAQKQTTMADRHDRTHLKMSVFSEEVGCFNLLVGIMIEVFLRWQWFLQGYSRIVLDSAAGAKSDHVLGREKRKNRQYNVISAIFQARLDFFAVPALSSVGPVSFQALTWYHFVFCCYVVMWKEGHNGKCR